MFIYLVSLIPVILGTISEPEKFLSEMKEFETSVAQQIGAWTEESVEARDCLSRLQELISAQEQVVALTKELDDLLEIPSPSDSEAIERVAEREYINVLTVDLELALSATAKASGRYKQSLLSFQKSLGNISM